MPDVPPPSAPNPSRLLCPYCGAISSNPKRCEECAGFFDPLSRQATQNAMGPWFIRDPKRPFHPGCSFETLRDMVRKGRITADTILRGPTTHQLWNFAARTPSVANLLGICHNCRREAKPDATECPACRASFAPVTDRQHLGLSPVHLLPGQAAPEAIAAASMTPKAGPPPNARRLPSAKWLAIALVASVLAFTAFLTREAVLAHRRDLATLRAAPSLPPAPADEPAPSSAAPQPAPIPAAPDAASITPPPPTAEAVAPEPAPTRATESLADTIAREIREGRLTDADLAQRLAPERATMSPAESAAWDALLARRDTLRRLARLP